MLRELPAHGYDVPALQEPLGLGDTDRGFVYRTLRAMETDGLAASVWDPSPAGPARRTYTVTAAGEEWVATVTAGLREADRHLAQWLARYRALADQGGPRSLPGVPMAS